MKNLLSLLAACVLLSACGGSSNTAAISLPELPQGDRFTSQVQGVVGNGANDSSDMAEAIAIDTIMASLPEEADPVPLG